MEMILLSLRLGCSGPKPATTDRLALLDPKMHLFPS